MKRLVVLQLLVLLSVLLLSGCTNKDDYASQSKWNVDEKLFIEYYKNFYSDLISEKAKLYDINAQQKIEFTDDYILKIYYETDDYIIKFRFTNHNSFAYYKSYYCRFDSNFEQLISFKLHEEILNFVNDVNQSVAYDFKGGVDTYKELYQNRITRKGDNSYRYHFDNSVGNIGYSVSLSDNYSALEDRWYLNFEFISLLKPQF